MQENEIGFEIRKLHLLINREFEKAGGKNVPTKLQIAIMVFICNRAKNKVDTYQKDIEKSFEIRPSTATEILRKMEKEGLITKESQSGDARLKKIILTEKAKKLKDQLKDGFLNLKATLTKGLSQEEISQYISITKKIQQNILEAHDVKTSR